jgi:predicted nucleic acid-binding protein
VTTYYLDTSALVKRYVDEAGSEWVRTTLSQSPSPSLIVVHLAIVEITSALTRRLRDGSLPPVDYARIQDAFRADCLVEYRIVSAVEHVIDEANRLLEQYPLRAYDAVHLAAAVVANQQLLAEGLSPLTFLSADERLNEAATAEGIAVDNPNHHLL